jgi:hypothetical protein
MVRAILSGAKTQTRRVVKPQPTMTSFAWLWVKKALRLEWGELANPDKLLPFCPYGQSGDQLWVKETHCYFNEANELVVAYRADDWTECPADDGKWKPSILCTRAASRITLEITKVRVERLQDIGEADAQAEGCQWRPHPTKCTEATNRAVFRDLWQSINGPSSWEANPWVWVIDFRRVKP